jgi:hypothetical protein
MLLGLCCPRSGVIEHITPGFEQQRRPVLGIAVVDFHGYDGWVGDLSLEMQKGESVLAPHSNSLASGAAL